MKQTLKRPLREVRPHAPKRLRVSPNGLPAWIGWRLIARSCARRCGRYGRGCGRGSRCGNGRGGGRWCGRWFLHTRFKSAITNGMDASRSPCLLGYDNNERRLWDFRFADRLRVIAEDRATTNELQIVSFPAANGYSTACFRAWNAHTCGECHAYPSAMSFALMVPICTRAKRRDLAIPELEKASQRESCVHQPSKTVPCEICDHAMHVLPDPRRRLKRATAARRDPTDARMRFLAHS